MGESDGSDDSVDSRNSCVDSELEIWRRERDLNPRGPKGPQAYGCLIPGLGFDESAPYQAREPRQPPTPQLPAEFKAVHEL